MTTRTAHLPVPDFGIRPVMFLAGLAAIALAVTAVVFFAGRGGETGEVELYTGQLAPVVERHNSAMARWNSFVADHNATAVHSLGEYDARAAATLVELSEIEAEVAATSAAWASIIPPTGYSEPHQQVLEAMTLTREGIGGIAAYFDDAIFGAGDYEQAQQALAMIDQASAFWAQAKSFES